MHGHRAFVITEEFRILRDTAWGPGAPLYFLGVVLAGFALAAGIPCLAENLALWPDCPASAGATLTAVGAAVASLTLAAWSLVCS